MRTSNPVSEYIRTAVVFGLAIVGSFVLLSNAGSRAQTCADNSPGSWFHREYCGAANVVAFAEMEEIAVVDGNVHVASAH